MYNVFNCIAVIFTFEILVADPTTGQKISINPQFPVRDIGNIIPKQYINSCENEEIVRLSGLRLTELPREFVKSERIKSIVMDDNDLTNIPRDAFSESPNLECLDLARNRIPYDGFQVDHPHLKTLILDNQRLSEWANVYSDNCVSSNTLETSFPNLENLSWKGVNFDCLLVTASTFPSLRNIDLSDSNMQSLDTNTSITQYMPHLRTVHLERNGIKTLSFYNLGSMEALYLDENPLNELWIDPTNTLKELFLSGCSFERPITLPTKSLVILDLSKNQLSEINTMFQYSQQLEILDLSNNKLNAFPALNSLYNLRKLSLAHNFIDRITNTIMLKSLKTLSLRGNQISVISEKAFWELGELEELDLSGNELETLPSNWYADWSVRMHPLLYLNLKSNKFTKIEDMSITQCYNLQELHIKGNYINEIDVHALQLIPDRCVLHVM